MTKLFALGALGAGGYAAVRAIKRRREERELDFDLSNLEEPVVVTEEVVIVTEAGPYEIDMELIPIEQVTADQPQNASAPVQMPGRGAGPR